MKKESNFNFRLRIVKFALITFVVITVGAFALVNNDSQASGSKHKTPEVITKDRSILFKEIESLLPDFAPTANAGDLDLTFGVDGTVQTDLGNNFNDSAQALAVQSDGKIITVGYADTVSGAKDFAVTRLNTNGTPDNSFNTGGKITFNFFSASRDDVAKAVAVQADGKIVVAGYADVQGFGNFDIVLARLNADGSFDTSFGAGGKVVTNLNDRADFGNALVLQSDGKIVVAGYSNRPTTGDDFVTVRYNANGSLDTSFNGTGIVITDILTNRVDRANGLIMQPDGKMVVVGYTDDPSLGNNFAVVYQEEITEPY